MSYYCVSLQGEHTYNTCINCDLTVSCNCTDCEGKGIIGNLNTDSFEEMWFSEDKPAHKFRRLLMAGIFPTFMCENCWALRKVDREVAVKKLKEVTLPKGVMVENSIICNYQCKWCCVIRSVLFGIRSRRQITLEDAEKVAKVCASMNVERISYFNVNEPFASPTILEELQVIRKYNPSAYIIISTNGSLITTDSARKAAMLLDELVVSIDGGSPEVAAKYQVGINFDKVVENVRQLVKTKADTASKVNIVWKYVVFPWNDSEEELKKGIELARSVGCDEIIFRRGDNDVYSDFDRLEHFRELPGIFKKDDGYTIKLKGKEK